MSTVSQESNVGRDNKKEGMGDNARREQRLAYWLLLPTFLILLAIAFYPLGSVFYISFTDRAFASTAAEPQFVGFDNYRNLLSLTVMQLPYRIDEATGQPELDADGNPRFDTAVRVLPREPVRYREVTQFNFLGTRYIVGATDPNFILAVRDTMIFTVASVVLETLLGLIVALVVNFPFPGRGLMRVIMLVPWAIPTAVSSKIWEGMFSSSRTGVINVIFQNLGIGNGQIPFLADPSWQLPAMIAIDVWKTTPFMALLILAGLQTIPSDLYEAADVDGAGPIRQFFSVTLPLLRPTLAVALVFRTLDALRVFDLFQIVLAQSRYSMASYAYYELIGNQQMGYSSAVSVLIFFLILIFAVVYIRLLGGVGDE